MEINVINGLDRTHEAKGSNKLYQFNSRCNLFQKIDISSMIVRTYGPYKNKVYKKINHHTTPHMYKNRDRYCVKR